MEPDAEQGWGRMIQLRAPWFVWLLLVLGIYMAITAPATLGAVAGFIDHLFVAVAGGLTHFLNSSVKGSLPGCIRRDRAATSSTSVTAEDHMPSELVGVAGFEPAASSSRSQVQACATSGLGRVACDRPSVGVRWRSPLAVAIVTHFVTRSLPSPS